MIEHIGVSESLGVAIFIMCVVFVVLFGIYLCVKLFSLITMKIEKNLKSSDSQMTN